MGDLLPGEALAASPPALPELAEPQVVRHFVNLSTLNMSVDTHFYPLGSCTMKYNPKRNERAGDMPGFAHLHPYQPEGTLQGMLQVLYELQEALQEISGLDACSLQPAAGAHGELTALWVAAAYFRDLAEQGQDNPRSEVLVPDNAHGTNPASAAMAGFKAVTVKTTTDGFVDLGDLELKLGDQTAVLMITNPSTLGLFEPNMRAIADRVHEAGGLIYLDGANMNAVLGITRPGDWSPGQGGADMMHFNPHKTFSGPHGGGGPGAGPICVGEAARPLSSRTGGAEKVRGRRSETGSIDLQYLSSDFRPRLPRRRPPQVDRPRALVRRQRGGAAAGVVLTSARTVRAACGAYRRPRCSTPTTCVEPVARTCCAVPQGDRCMHEFVASARQAQERSGASPRWTSPSGLLGLRLPRPDGLLPA